MHLCKYVHLRLRTYELPPPPSATRADILSSMGFYEYNETNTKKEPPSTRRNTKLNKNSNGNESRHESTPSTGFVRRTYLLPHAITNTCYSGSASLSPHHTRGEPIAPLYRNFIHFFLSTALFHDNCFHLAPTSLLRFLSLIWKHCRSSGELAVDCDAPHCYEISVGAAKQD